MCYLLVAGTAGRSLRRTGEQNASLVPVLRCRQFGRHCWHEQRVVHAEIRRGIRAKQMEDDPWSILIM